MFTIIKNALEKFLFFNKKQNTYDGGDKILSPRTAPALRMVPYYIPDNYFYRGATQQRSRRQHLP